LFITSIPDIFVTIFFARILQGYHRNGPLTAAPSSIGRIALTVLLIGIFLCAAFVAISLATISGITLYTAAAVIAGLAITTALGLTTGLLYLSVELNRRFGKPWVKSLDFPYLLLGFFGLLRILNGSPAIADHYYFLDAVVAWTNSERRSDDATPESVPPPPKGEGTVRRSSSSTLITRPANRTIEDKADTHQRGYAPRTEVRRRWTQSEVMTSPASPERW